MVNREQDVIIELNSISRAISAHQAVLRSMNDLIPHIFIRGRQTIPVGVWNSILTWAKGLFPFGPTGENYIVLVTEEVSSWTQLPHGNQGRRMQH